MPKGDRPVKARVASGDPCLGVSMSRGKGNDLAQEFSPPPAAIDGTDILAASKRKTRQGTKKKQLAVVKKTCIDAGCQNARCQVAPELHMLQTLQPASLSAIRADGWEEVEMAVDSGASETVVGEDMIVTANLKESEGSRRGIEYKVANGDSIPNLGEKKFKAWTREGVGRNITLALTGWWAQDTVWCSKQKAATSKMSPPSNA